MTTPSDDVNATVARGYSPLPIDPPWLDTAWAHLGQREAAGTANAPWLMRLAENLPAWVRAFYTADSIPWCGLFVAHCLRSAGYQIPSNPLSAKAYLALPSDSEGQPTRGAIAIFTREGGGHVGFVLGMGEGHVDVLGGNQADAVTVMRFPRYRLLGLRWPEMQA